jgi:antitoxin CptB
MSQNLTSRQKKLLFRAWHRGTREADLMMGRFAQDHIGQCDEAQLDIFEDFLDESDADIFDWVTGRLALPDLPCRAFLEQMQAFYG